MDPTAPRPDPGVARLLEQRPGVESFTTADVAAVLGVTRATVARSIRRGGLEARKVGGRWLVTPVALVASTTWHPRPRAR